MMEKIISNFTDFSNKKLVLIKQHNDISCGPTSLLMISNYFNIKSSVEELEKVMDTRETGTSIHGMLDGLKYLSLKTIRFKFYWNKRKSYNMLNKALDNGYIFLFRTLINGANHWICCDGITGDKLNIVDSWYGEYQLTLDELETIWSPRERDGFAITGTKKINPLI